LGADTACATGSEREADQRPSEQLEPELAPLLTVMNEGWAAG